MSTAISTNRDIIIFVFDALLDNMQDNNSPPFLLNIQSAFLCHTIYILLLS